MSLILSLYANAGVLHEVNHIHRNTTHLFWQAPFSLDLTNADPDIVYCVEVYNITCGRSLLISECDVMETSYTNDALLPDTSMSTLSLLGVMWRGQAMEPEKM